MKNGRRCPRGWPGKCAESVVTIAGAVEGSHRTGKALRPADLGHRDLVPKAGLVRGYDPLKQSLDSPSIDPRGDG